MLQVAIVFTIACVILSGNAVLSFWPNISPGFQPPAVVLYIEGVLSVISCGLFLVGGVFSFIGVIQSRRPEERWREEVWEKYGTVVVEDEVGDEEEKVEEKSHREPVRITVTEMLERTTSLARTFSLTADQERPFDGARAENTEWRGIPTMQEMRLYCLSETQCVASFISLISSFIYTITAVMALISIFQTGNIATWIRFPQLVAAVGFAITSALQMVQCQPTWWRPALKRVVWHANLLNLIGSFGFIVCSVMGLLQHHWAEFQFGATFLWGSWAYLFASAMSSYNAYRKSRKVVETSKV